MGKPTRKKKKYVDVPLDVPPYVIYILALQAHRKGITLNKYVNNILIKRIKEIEE